MSFNYEDLGLTSLLNSNTSLSERGNNLTSSFDFDSIWERGVINTVQIRDAAIDNAKLGTAVIGTANIGTLSFNEIAGGTATLGGTNNGNGFLSVKNNSGTEVVRLDNTGILVTNGSITIQNSSGSNIVDSFGLVSSTNFDFNSYYSSDIITVTGGGGSYSDISGSDLSIILSRQSRVLILSTCYSQNQVPYAIADWHVDLNGTSQSPPGLGYGLFRDSTPNLTNPMPCTVHFVVNMSAGTNTIKLRWRTNPASGTAEMSYRRLSYLVLGV